MMKRASLASLLLLAFVQIADAESAPPVEKDADEAFGLVLVNATQKLGDFGKIDKLRRVLDSLGRLHKLPRRLEAALDGRAVLIADVDAIKDAYANLSFDTALKIITEDEARILTGASSGDPMPALSELSEWRGLIEAAKNNEDLAIEWFRAAYRLNPARQLDKRLVSPRVRTLIKKAHREVTEVGFLRVDADPENAEVRIDGGKAQA